MGEITSPLMCGQPLALRTCPCAWPLPFSSDPALSHCLEGWLSVLCITLYFYRDGLPIPEHPIKTYMRPLKTLASLIKQISTTSIHPFRWEFRPQPPKQATCFARWDSCLEDLVKWYLGSRNTSDLNSSRTRS